MFKAVGPWRIENANLSFWGESLIGLPTRALLRRILEAYPDPISCREDEFITLQRELRAATSQIPSLDAPGHLHFRDGEIAITSALDHAPKFSKKGITLPSYGLLFRPYPLGPMPEEVTFGPWRYIPLTDSLYFFDRQRKFSEAEKNFITLLLQAYPHALSKESIAEHLQCAPDRGVDELYERILTELKKAGKRGSAYVMRDSDRFRISSGRRLKYDFTPVALPVEEAYLSPPVHDLILA